MPYIRKNCIALTSDVSPRILPKLSVPLFIAVIFVSFSGCAYFEGYAVQDYLNKVASIQYSCDLALLNLSEDLNSLSGD